jgi:ELWxxDGT repeat protein
MALLALVLAQPPVEGDVVARSASRTKSDPALLKDILPGEAGSRPHEMLAVGDRLFFTATDLEHGTELWVSDSTPDGTRLVIDLRPGFESSTPHRLLAYDGDLYFFASVDSLTLWVTDGTSAGTRSVLANPVKVTNVGRDLVAAAGDPLALYRIEGDVALPIPMSGLRDRLSDITSIGNALMVWTYGTYGTPPIERGDLYRLDVLTGEAVHLLDAVWGLCGRPGCSATPMSWHNSGSHIVVMKEALWQSDGSTAGTLLLAKDVAGANALYSAAEAGDDREFILLGSALSWDLWRSDGTPAGTALMTRLQPGSSTAPQPELATIYGSLVLSADDGVHGRELLRLGSTGLHLIADLVPGPGSSYPTELTAAGGSLLFQATSEAGVPLLWASDGTPDGTSAIWPLAEVGNKRFALVGDRLFFASATAATGAELWSIPAEEVLQPFTPPERERAYAPLVAR